MAERRAESDTNGALQVARGQPSFLVVAGAVQLPAVTLTESAPVSGGMSGGSFKLTLNIATRCRNSERSRELSIYQSFLG